MNFTSLFYLPLYALTAALYPRLGSPSRAALLLLASWTFFLLESPASGVILFAVTVMTWLAGLGMARFQDRPGLRRLLLGTVLAVTLGLLGIFKYTGLFFLPAGISFYTFQALSYSIDVYRGDYPAERSFPRYALYLSFFPQVVAGPIERPKDLLGQLRCETPVTAGDLRVGGYLLLRGYVKKIVIADMLAPTVDALFAAGGAADGLQGLQGFRGPQVCAAAILFALQIYADFSGYSDIALGSARMLGIRLSENFRNPYLAVSLRDFWRRWHITLNRWLTEYVYIPLGGNRKGPARTALNTLIVFAVSGLWHGRGAHFIAWGLVHGILVLAGDGIARLTGSGSSGGSRSPSGRFLRQAGTFLLVSLLWILFRAPSLAQAWAMYRALPLGWGQAIGDAVVWCAGHRILAARLLMTVPLLCLLRRTPSETDVPPGNVALAVGYLLFLLTLVSLFLNLQTGGAAPFIYFQF